MSDCSIRCSDCFISVSNASVVIKLQLMEANPAPFVLDDISSVLNSQVLLVWMMIGARLRLLIGIVLAIPNIPNIDSDFILI